VIALLSSLATINGHENNKKNAVNLMCASFSLFFPSLLSQRLMCHSKKKIGPSLAMCTGPVSIFLLGPRDGNTRLDAGMYLPAPPSSPSLKKRNHTKTCAVPNQPIPAPFALLAFPSSLGPASYKSLHVGLSFPQPYTKHL